MPTLPLSQTLLTKIAIRLFEKIESAARKRALAFANQKNADALRTFMDDEEMQKAIYAVQGGSRVDSDL